MTGEAVPALAAFDRAMQTYMKERNISAGSLAVIVGSEGAGVPRAVTSKVDEMVKIPHPSQVESLNAGVAASIVLYEIARQRLGSSRRADDHRLKPDDC